MAAAQKNRLPLLLVIGGVLIVILLLVKFVFFKSSSSSTASSTTTSISVPIQSSTTTSTLPITGDENLTFAFAPDPFIPLVSNGSTSGASGASTSGASTGATTPTTTPTTVASGSASPTTTQLPTSTDQSLYGLQLTGMVSVQQAPGVSVKVSGHRYTVGIGQTFAQNYRLVGVNDTCAQFVYGDAPFQACASH